MSSDKTNHPGAPANPPQHIPGDYGEGKNPSGARPSSESPNEPPNNVDTADPHPDTEEGYDRKTKVPAPGL